MVGANAGVYIDKLASANRDILCGSIVVRICTRLALRICKVEMERFECPETIGIALIVSSSKHFAIARVRIRILKRNILNRDILAGAEIEHMIGAVRDGQIPDRDVFAVHNVDIGSVVLSVFCSPIPDASINGYVLNLGVSTVVAVFATAPTACHIPVSP